jgi:Cdc6-like AAA superfamily ATPase
MKYYTLVKYDLENNNKQLATLQEEINTAIANSLLLFFILYGQSSSGKSHTTKLILQSIRDKSPQGTNLLK